MTDLFGHDAPLVTETTFAEFWALVPCKIARAAAERKWKQLGQTARKAATDAVAGFYRWWRKENPDATWLHPATYLHNRRWEDDWTDPIGSAPVVTLKFWADWINSDKPLPTMGIPSRVQAAVFSAGLVSSQRMNDRIG